MPSDVHIGQKIREVFRTQSVPVAAFAAQIGIARQNVYRIFEQPDLDTDLLMKISQALAHDFFRYFQPLPGQPTVTQQPAPDPETAARLAHCQQELDRSHREIDYLKRMVSLMEERIAYLSGKQ